MFIAYHFQSCFKFIICTPYLDYYVSVTYTYTNKHKEFHIILNLPIYSTSSIFAVSTGVDSRQSHVSRIHRITDFIRTNDRAVGTVLTNI